MLSVAAKVKTLPEDSMEFYKTLEREMALLDCVIKARQNFGKWWLERETVKEYPQQSYQLEFNLHAEKPGLIHHHVVFTKLGDPFIGGFCSHHEAQQGRLPRTIWANECNSVASFDF